MIVNSFIRRLHDGFTPDRQPYSTPRFRPFDNGETWGNAPGHGGKWCSESACIHAIPRPFVRSWDCWKKASSTTGFERALHGRNEEEIRLHFFSTASVYSFLPQMNKQEISCHKNALAFGESKKLASNTENLYRKRMSWTRLYLGRIEHHKQVGKYNRNQQLISHPQI